jgi:hypothetical protein
MNGFISMFSPLLQLFPHFEFQRIVKKNQGQSF